MDANEDYDGFVSEPQQFDPLSVEFGILFDIDGVLARGLNPLPQAKKMMNLLKDENQQLKLPIAFVTNGCGKGDAKAKLLSKWFDTEITGEQAIHSQSPLSVFKHWHQNFTLFVGQGDIHGIAKELGFTNICTLEDVKDAYPRLDVVNHANRKTIANGYKEKSLPRVEAIVLIGEPVAWESNLQLIIDLLVTNGKPDCAPDSYPKNHLPITACNMDLVFMAEAPMPRLAHGAFLCCLEALYKKITGNTLTYTNMVGKPSEVTYRYAEHTLSNVAKKLRIESPLKRIYFIGDNPDVDIVGANIYNRYLNHFRRLSGGNLALSQNEVINIQRKVAVASSRQIPDEAKFSPQTVKRVESILVGTGIYNPNAANRDFVDHRHRDFQSQACLHIPTCYAEDVYEAVRYILRQESIKIEE